MGSLARLVSYHCNCWEHLFFCVSTIVTGVCCHAQCTMTLDHGSPVEATAFLPGGALLATAGGTEIRCVLRVWTNCQCGVVSGQAAV